MKYDKVTFESLAQGPQTNIEGRWVPSRPIPYVSWINRLKLAWDVFTYKADAFYWNKKQPPFLPK